MENNEQIKDVDNISNDANNVVNHNSQVLNNDNIMPTKEKNIEKSLKKLTSEEPKKEKHLKNQNENKNKKSNKYIILIIVIVIIILVTSFLLYKILVMDKGIKNKDDNKENEEIFKPTTGKYTVNIYKYSTDVFCKENCTGDDLELVYTIKTETENAKIITFDSYGNYMLYNDNGLKLYDIKNQKK